MKKEPSWSSAKPVQDRSNVLPLKGEIDLHVSPSVTASLNEIIDKKPKRLVVDLSSVTYIDSAGLAALIQAMQKVEAYGGKFLLARSGVSNLSRRGCRAEGVIRCRFC